MFELDTAASTCRFGFATRDTTAHKSGNLSHATGHGPAGSATKRSARGVGPTRARVSIAAQFPSAFSMEKSAFTGPSRVTTRRASSNVSEVRIALGSSPAAENAPSEALYPPFPGSERRASGTLSNARAASTTRAPPPRAAKHALGSTRNDAPARVTSSYAGIRSSSVSAASASRRSWGAPTPSHAASRAAGSVARRSTTEDMRCGTAMDWLYADHPILGSCIPITCPSARAEAGTPSASAPRRGGRFTSGFGPCIVAPWPTRSTSAPSARIADANANWGRAQGVPGHAARAYGRRAAAAAASAASSLAATSTALAPVSTAAFAVSIARCTSFPSSNATSTARSSPRAGRSSASAAHKPGTVSAAAHASPAARGSTSMTLPPSSACAPAAQPASFRAFFLALPRGAASIQPAGTLADPPRAAGRTGRSPRSSEG